MKDPIKLGICAFLIMIGFAGCCFILEKSDTEVAKRRQIEAITHKIKMETK